MYLWFPVDCPQPTAGSKDLANVQGPNHRTPYSSSHHKAPQTARFYISELRTPATQHAFISEERHRPKTAEIISPP